MLALPQDYAFTGAARDSNLAGHIQTPTRARGSNEASTLDLFSHLEKRPIKIERCNPHWVNLIKLIYQYQGGNLGTKVMFHYMKGDYKKMQRMQSLIISEKTQEKTSFMETISRNKDAKVYQDYCRERNQVRRNTRKTAGDQEKNILSHLQYDSKMFRNYINSKMKLSPSISQSFIDEKADVNTENNFF